MAENTGGIFTTVGVSIDRLRELGQVGKQLKGQLGGLGKELSTVGTKLQDIGKMRYPRGTVLDQFGQPIVSKIQATSTAVTGLGSRLGMLGTRLGQARASLAAFGTSFGRILGRATLWFAAFKLIMGTIRGIGDVIQDLKDLEMESIFLKPAIAAGNLESILREVSPLAEKWGLNVITSLRGVQQISRSLSDMYEMDLPSALALTDVAMKITVTTGQNLNETISNMVGYIRLLGLESVGDIDKFMSTLFAAAYLTNESLTESGKSVSKAALAYDSLTDAIQKMLPSLVRFGLSHAEIAAIASIFITNLDESGEGLGKYAAELFETVKNNKQLVDAYREVGVELERGPKLIAQMAGGWQVMVDAQKDVVASALDIGKGAHVPATFVEGLLQIKERAIEIQKNENLLNIKAVQIMGTLQKKQDKLKTSLQVLALTASQQYLPTIKDIVDVGKDFIDTTTWMGEALIGAPLLAMQAFGKEMDKLTAKRPKRGTWDEFLLLVTPFKAATRTIKHLLQSEGAAWDEYVDRVMRTQEKLVKDYGESQLRLQAIFKAAQKGKGATVSGELLLEQTKDVMKRLTREVNIATYALGPYASAVEMANAKIIEYRKGLIELVALRQKMVTGSAGTEQIREQEEAIGKMISLLGKQLKIINDVNFELDLGCKYRLMEASGLDKIVIIQEKIRDLKKEQSKLDEQALGFNAKQLEIYELQTQQQEESARKITEIKDRLESTVATSVKGLIRGTKEWKDILADIGGTILDIIIEKLMKAWIIDQALGLMATAVGGLFSAPATTTTSGGGFSPSAAGVGFGNIYHTGGPIKDMNLPSFQVGGEVPILAQPGEFMVRNGPSQRHRELLENINSGRGTDQTMELTLVNVVDPSFVSASIRKDPRMVINMIDENLLRAGSTRRIIHKDLGD